MPSALATLPKCYTMQELQAQLGQASKQINSQLTSLQQVRVASVAGC